MKSACGLSIHRIDNETHEELGKAQWLTYVDTKNVIRLIRGLVTVLNKMLDNGDRYRFEKESDRGVEIKFTADDIEEVVINKGCRYRVVTVVSIEEFIRIVYYLSGANDIPCIKIQNMQITVLAAGCQAVLAINCERDDVPDRAGHLSHDLLGGCANNRIGLRYEPAPDKVTRLPVKAVDKAVLVTCNHIPTNNSKIPHVVCSLK